MYFSLGFQMLLNPFPDDNAHALFLTVFLFSQNAPLRIKEASNCITNVLLGPHSI